jgi:photosystem II stability/assembly factor-like uncharacterized protein
MKLSRKHFAISTTWAGAKIASLLLACFIFSGVAHAATYAWVDQSSLGTQIWGSAALSLDGTKMVAGAFGGNLFISTDGGGTWATSTAAGTAHWDAITVSSDGQKIAATVGPFNSGGMIYTTTNGGVSWTTSNPGGGSRWATIAGSSDGNKLVAASNGDFTAGDIYTSIDAGQTWATSTSAGTSNWEASAYSANGNKIAVADASYIYISNDGGGTWATSTTAIGSLSWSSVSMSANGSKIVGATTGGSVYISQDGGATWTLTSYSPGDVIGSVAISGDGSTIAAGVGFPFGYDPVGPISISTDNGISWQAETATGDQDWAWVGLSNDGSQLMGVAGADFGPSGDVWTASYAVPPTIVSVTPLNASSNIPTTAPLVINFSEPIATSTVVVSTSPCFGTCVSYTENWTNSNQTLTLTNTSNWVLGTTYSVSLSATSSGGAALASPYNWSFTIQQPAPQTPISHASSSGGRVYGCKDQSAMNYNPFTASSPSLCEYQSSGALATSTMQVGSSTQTATHFIFGHDLDLGSTSSDAFYLQKYLNESGFAVAKNGPGSIGMETNYFGSATKASVIKFQIAHNIQPSVGYFGPLTRRVINGF